MSPPTSGLRQISDSSRSAAGPFELETVLSQGVAREVAALRPDAWCVIWLTDTAAGGYRLAATCGAKAQDLPSLLSFGEGLTHVVAETRRPLLALGAAADPPAHIRDLGAFEHLPVFYGVPIQAGQQVLGTLDAHFPAGAPPTEDERKVMERLAGQAAEAIRSVRLLQESEARRQAAEALAEVARLLSETLDLDAVGKRITDNVQKLFAAQSSALYRLDPASGDLVGLAGSGEMGPAFLPGIVMPRGNGLVGLAVREGRPVATPNVLTDPRLAFAPEVRARIESAPYRAALAVPLMVQGRVIGALSVADEPGRSFGREELGMAQAFADQAALALENARLYEETERRRREAEVLAELAGALNSTLDLDTLLQRVADGASELCGSDAARIGLWDPRAGAVILRYAAGAMDDAWREVRVEPGKGLGGLALTTGRPVRTDRYAEDPRITPDYLAVCQATGAVAVLAVPIQVGADQRGLLYVSNRSPRPLTDRDEAILVRLAALAGTAIRHARLFEAEQAARAAAEASGQRFRDLVESLDAIVWEADATTWVFTFVSQRAETLLGHPLARWLTEPGFWASRIHPEDRERVISLCRAQTGEGRDHEIDYRFAAADGRHIWLRDIIHVVPDAEGRARLLRGVMVDITERKREAELRARLLNDVIRAQQEERARLARELHDDTGQSLASLLIGLSTLKATRTLKAARRQATALHRRASASLREIRRLAWGLRPSVLDDLGLVAALERYAAEYSGARGIAACVESRGLEAARLPSAVETALYRIAQEALANVAKHAEARTVTMLVERKALCAMLTVTDDGRGFDVGEALGTPVASEHFGLHTMRERAALLNGTVTIESRPGEGTSVRTHIPLPEKADGENPRPDR